jgi:hypothetical protein
MASVRLPTVLQRYAGGAEPVAVAGSTVAESLRMLVTAHPDLEERLFDGAGRVRSHFSIVVGDRVLSPDILDAASVEAGDEIVVLVALAGG